MDPVQVQQTQKSHHDTPLIVFIIFGFFALISLIGLRTYYSTPPSVLTMACQSYMLVLSCFILMMVGLVSVYAEWSIMFGFTLIVLLFIAGSLEPVAVKTNPV